MNRNKVLLVLFVVALLFGLKLYSRRFIQIARIAGSNMSPTLLEGDRLLLNKVEPRLRSPRRGEIVSFLYPAKSKESPHYGKAFVARVIGIEGDKVEIINKKVLVNEQPLSEPYASFAESTVYPPIKKQSDLQFQTAWEGQKFEGLEGNNIRDNFGPILVRDGKLFVLGDNRERSFDSRFWGPLPVENLRGFAWRILWPFNRRKNFEI